MRMNTSVFECTEELFLGALHIAALGWDLLDEDEGVLTNPAKITFLILSTWKAISPRPSHSSSKLRACVALINFEWNSFPSKKVQGRHIWTGMGSPQLSFASKAISTP